MSVTAAIDEALIGRLQADATLLALAPGKVHLDFAPEGTAEPFVVVNLQVETPTHEFGATAFLKARLQAKAVAQATSAASAKAAADRIFALLNDASFVITGYTNMLCHAVERFGYVERDGPLRWQHRGFDFDVWAS